MPKSEHEEPTPEEVEKPLDPKAAQVLDSMLSDLRVWLIREAHRYSTGRKISDDDLATAYKRLHFPSRGSIQFSDAQDVVSRALRENRTFEWVAYGMAFILFAFGLALLTWGVTGRETSLRIGALVSGSLVELLILIPFRFAINSRRHNMALRMLGLILDRVEDPRIVASILKDTFLAIVLDKRKPGK